MKRGAFVARPTKWRKIEQIPRYPLFAPAGPNRQGMGENTLKVEELEAVRLKDLEGLEQEECAERMEVSRPTFQRILISARAKIADSLVHGKTIRIEGGNYTQGICPVRCLDCGRIWQESIEHMLESNQNETETTCPSCQSENVACCPEDMEQIRALSPACLRACRGHGNGSCRGHQGGRKGSAHRGAIRESSGKS